MVRKVLVLWMLAVCGFFSSCFAEEEIDCSKEYLLNYFPEVVVNKVLHQYQIPGELWPQINQELQAQEASVVDIVREEASKMKPNPLYDPKQKNVASELFRQALYQIFTNVMNKNGVQREEQISAMMDLIQYKKAKLFNDCIQKKQQMR